MLWRLVDKLLFGVLLLAALQLPQLADHYRQYLAGYLQSVDDQLTGYRLTARRHGYVDLQAMIDDHLRNPTPSVRADADQKQRLLQQQHELHQSMTVLQQGNLLQQSLHIFAPSHLPILKQTLHNFTPGIPLHSQGLLFGVLVALGLNLLLSTPWLIMRVWRRRWQRRKHSGDRVGDSMGR